MIQTSPSIQRNYTVRAPNGNLGRCLEILNTVLESLGPKLNIIVSGDFNVYFDGKDCKASELCDLFLSYGMYSTTNFPTRGAVCLDNIFTNIENPDNQTPLRMNHLSDHDGTIYKFHGPSHRKIAFPLYPKSPKVHQSQFASLSRTRRGIDYHCVKLLNVLPENVRALPDELFYAKIKTYLLRKVF
nr:unnamed protein product [Callosobruchus analis]